MLRFTVQISQVVGEEINNISVIYGIDTQFEAKESLTRLEKVLRENIDDGLQSGGLFRSVIIKHSFYADLEDQITNTIIHRKDWSYSCISIKY